MPYSYFNLSALLGVIQATTLNSEFWILASEFRF